MKLTRTPSLIWHTHGNDQFFQASRSHERVWLKHALLTLSGRTAITSWVIYLPFIALFIYLSENNSSVLPLMHVLPWTIFCLLIAIGRSIFSYFLTRLKATDPLDRYELINAFLCALLSLALSSGVVYFFKDIDANWVLIIMMMVALLAFGAVFTISGSLLSFSFFTIILLFPIAYIGIRSPVSSIKMTSASFFFLIPLLFYFEVRLYRLLVARFRRELTLLNKLEIDGRLMAILNPAIFVSMDQKIISVNDNLLNLLNVESSEVVNHSFTTVFPDHHHMVRQLQRLYFDLEKQVQESAEVSSPSFEVSFPQHGKTLYFSVSCHLLMNTSGERICVWVLHDVTAAHESELALRKKEQIYRSLVEVSDEMLVCLDDQMNMIFSNERGTRKLFGFSITNVSTQNFYDLFYEKELFKKEDLYQVRDLKTSIYKEASIRISTGLRKRVRVSLSPFHQTNLGVSFVAVVSESILSGPAEDHMSYLATHDELTGLPNRRYLMDRLMMMLGSYARRSGEVIALFLIDLDKFKSVNDIFGHKAGDHVLEVSSLRLRSCARKTDVVARMGGDEFVMFLSGFPSAKDVASIAQRVVDVIGEPIPFGKDLLQVYASVGIALYPLDGMSSEVILNVADRAMYSAKKAGANRYCFQDSRSVEEMQLLINSYL